MLPLNAIVPSLVTTKKSPVVRAILLAPAIAGEFADASYPPWNTPTPATSACTCPKLTPSFDAVPFARDVSLKAPKLKSALGASNTDNETLYLHWY